MRIQQIQMFADLKCKQIQGKHVKMLFLSTKEKSKDGSQYDTIHIVHIIDSVC